MAGLAIRSPQNVVGGIALIGLSALAFSGMNDLEMGTSTRMGSGYFPMTLAGLVGMFGLVITGQGFALDGPPTTSWGWRHILPLLLAIGLFAVLIRPAGMVIASLALIIPAAIASREVIWRETLIFGAGLVTFTVLLFKVALNLPLTIWPRF